MVGTMVRHVGVYRASEQGEVMNKVTRPITAYLSVYQLTRHYGGPEEGGWWYDAWEHTGAAFPYQATQEYEAAIADLDTDQETHQVWYDEETKDYMKWEPVGIPVPINKSQEVLMQAAEAQFELIYGKQGTGHRYSCAQRADDFKFIHEQYPGQHETKGRPRYE